MDYDIVIASANRPDIFRVSLPLMLCQTRPARTMIIADASDDHDAVVRTVREATPDAPFPVEICQVPRGAARQRNAVLDRIRSPVVFFPDDDSLWYADVAEKVMRIYERDADQRIGGVSQAETFEPPIRLTQQHQRARSASALAGVKYRMGSWRHWFLNFVVDNPLHLCGGALLDRHKIPGWLPEVDAQPTVRIVGFRRSYRTDSVRRYGFDEDLHPPRAALEDFQLSFHVLRDQILVEATTARVFHHQFGGRRGPGRGVEAGVQQFLNLCYVVCKNSPPGSRARRAIYPYSRAFLAEALLLRAPTSAFERERVKGIQRARREFNYLIESPPEELTARYKAAFDRCLRGQPAPA